LDKANPLDLINSEKTAIDASKLKSYERAIPKSHFDENDCGNINWGTKFDSLKKQDILVQLKVYLTVDTKSELTIAVNFPRIMKLNVIRHKKGK